jgi:hypothetical protein
MNEENLWDKMSIMLDYNDGQLEFVIYVVLKYFFYCLLLVNLPYRNPDISNLEISHPLNEMICIKINYFGSINNNKPSRSNG